jgi:hypothetical protein
VITIQPLLYFAGFLAYLPVVALRNGSSLPPMGVMATLHVSTMVISISLMAFYVVHAVRSGHVGDEQKTPWVILLLFGSIVVMPIYWYFRIWKSGHQNDFEKGECDEQPPPPARRAG